MFGGPNARFNAGSFPASARKFKGTHPRRQIPEPTRDPDGMRFSLGQTAARAAQTTLRGPNSIAGGPTRRTFTEKRSEVSKWKPGLRKVPAPVPHDDRARGLRSLPMPKPTAAKEAQRTHFPEKWNQRTTSCSEFGGGGTLGCKIRVKDAAGNPKCERQADELDVTRMFGRKRRVDPTQTSTLRNGIGVSKPGDKRYSHPDYAPGFFKGGGVYPGSGWGNQKPLQPYHTTQFAAAAKKQKEREDAATAGRMTYEQRRRYEIMRKEIEEVRALNPESNDGETWEQRTGQFTVPPPAPEPVADEEATA